MTWSLMDLIIVLVLVLGMLHGLVRGIGRTLGGIFGLLLGGAAALWLIPLIPVDGGGVGVRLLMLGGLVVLGMLGGHALGEALLGRIAGMPAQRSSRAVAALDALGGAVLSTAASGLVVLAAVSTLASGPAPALGAHAERSPMMRAIDDVVPSSLTGLLERTQQRVAGSAAARELDTLLFAPAAPPEGDVEDPEILAAAESVVQIVGFAPQCSARLSGSGFAAADGQVVTNAHVVAGTGSVFVHDAQGRRHEARVVIFDPQSDLAVLDVPSLGVPVLPIADAATLGAEGAFIGYPGGGALSIGPAEVQGTALTSMTSIDADASAAPVEVLQFAGDVQQGNSGGPLVDGDGAVLGVVFARSSSGPAGFAVSTEQLRSALSAADGADQAVSTQDCEPAHAG
ncbi:MarP family serine protease [Kocuria sp. p3-SID1428]|uniref:MarP family serine protease n=2 Tax=unclassified Kocuria TaxID=2649579 RepID=UPI0021A43849|nr:MarP family serine protease [Kocuria sp. p3-SID1428]MCT1602071.1 MarP family serine protease [Kocuria sp. p3-SID1428]